MVTCVLTHLMNLPRHWTAHSRSSCFSCWANFIGVDPGPLPLQLATDASAAPVLDMNRLLCCAWGMDAGQVVQFMD
jgi:hypothetical protein